MFSRIVRVYLLSKNTEPGVPAITWATRRLPQGDKIITEHQIFPDFKMFGRQRELAQIDEFAAIALCQILGLFRLPEGPALPSPLITKHDLVGHSSQEWDFRRVLHLFCSMACP